MSVEAVDPDGAAREDFRKLEDEFTPSADLDQLGDIAYKLRKLASRVADQKLKAEILALRHRVVSREAELGLEEPDDGIDDGPTLGF